MATYRCARRLIDPVNESIPWWYCSDGVPGMGRPIWLRLATNRRRGPQWQHKIHHLSTGGGEVVTTAKRVEAKQLPIRHYWMLLNQISLAPVKDTELVRSLHG